MEGGMRGTPLSSALYLDTHVAAFLFAGLIDELSNDAKRHLEGHSEKATALL